jgi:hypothetical protein
MITVGRCPPARKPPALPSTTGKIASSNVANSNKVLTAHSQFDGL